MLTERQYDSIVVFFFFVISFAFPMWLAGCKDLRLLLFVLVRGAVEEAPPAPRAIRKERAEELLRGFEDGSRVEVRAAAARSLYRYARVE